MTDTAVGTRQTSHTGEERGAEERGAEESGGRWREDSPVGKGRKEPNVDIQYIVYLLCYDLYPETWWWTGWNCTRKWQYSVVSNGVSRIDQSMEDPRCSFFALVRLNIYIELPRAGLAWQCERKNSTMYSVCSLSLSLSLCACMCVCLSVCLSVGVWCDCEPTFP